MSLWSYLTGTEDQATADARYAAQQQHLAGTVDARLAAATLSDQQANTIRQNYLNGGLDSVDTAAQQGFIEGAQDGLNNVLAAPGNAISGAGGVVGSILKNIPWWAWVLGAGAIFIYLGGGLWLLKRAKGAFAR